MVSKKYFLKSANSGICGSTKIPPAKTLFQRFLAIESWDPLWLSSDCFPFRRSNPREPINQSILSVFIARLPSFFNEYNCLPIAIASPKILRKITFRQIFHINFKTYIRHSLTNLNYKKYLLQQLEPQLVLITHFHWN